MGGREGLLVVFLRGAFRLTALSTWMHNVATAWTTSRSVQVNTYTNNFSFYPLPGPVTNIFILHMRPAIHFSSTLSWTTTNHLTSVCSRMPSAYFANADIVSDCVQATESCKIGPCIHYQLSPVAAQVRWSEIRRAINTDRDRYLYVHLQYINAPSNHHTCIRGQDDDFNASVEQVTCTQNPTAQQYSAVVVALMERHATEL